ncbi:MAG: hypothetical protein JXA67_11160 [Micromonosporaceae bacterium]|nr:hypothetical protein [Micromonosporaceae bacterium]
MEIAEPGTVDDLLADAARHGHAATARLITDWVSQGLLDRPSRRPRGRGQGSAKGLYPANQRHLFLTLLDKRGQGARHVDSLARVPIFIWLYWGDDYVPTRQVVRALRTWHGDGAVNLEQARRSAQRMLTLLDHPLATPANRQALIDVLTDIAWKGRIDDRAQLEQAVRTVFEPPTVFQSIKRAIGRPAAAIITADTALGLIEARWTASIAIKDCKIDEDELNEARQHHLRSRLEYLTERPALQAHMQEPFAELFAPETPQALFDHCALGLSTTIGLQILARRRQRS